MSLWEDLVVFTRPGIGDALIKNIPVRSQLVCEAWPLDR